MELLAHWNLRERPFEATWDTRFFYASPEHEEALNRLIYLVNETSMNLGMLSGDIGCGKTLTRSVFAERLDPQRFRVVMLENSGFPFTDLLAAILRRVETTPGNGGETKFARCERLQQCLERMHAEGQHLVLLFDEAQDMPSNTLHELRWLTNFNGGGRTVVTLVLIGQPELRSLVAGNAAINQRISLRFHLKPLRREDVEPYVRHRLRMAGHPTGEVFSAEAADVLYEATRAVPREMNRLAKLALEQAWLREAASVEAESVKSVMRDLINHQARPVT